MKENLSTNSEVEVSKDELAFCPTMLKEVLFVDKVRGILNSFFRKHSDLLDLYTFYFSQPTTPSINREVFIGQFAQCIHKISRAVIKHINETSTKVLAQEITPHEVQSFDFIAEDTSGHSIHTKRRVYYVQEKIDAIFATKYSLFEGYQALCDFSPEFPPFQELVESVFHHHKSLGLFLDYQNSVNSRIYENATMKVIDNCLRKLLPVATNPLRGIRSAIFDQPNNKLFYIHLNWSSPTDDRILTELPMIKNHQMIELAAQQTIAPIVTQVREIEADIASLEKSDAKKFDKGIINRRYRISSHYIGDAGSKFYYDYEKICDICTQYTNKRVDEELFALSPEQLIVFYACLHEVYQQLPPEVIIPLIRAEGINTFYIFKDTVNFSKIVDNLPIFKSLAYDCYKCIKSDCYPINGEIQTLNRKINYY